MKKLILKHRYIHDLIKWCEYSLIPVPIQTIPSPDIGSDGGGIFENIGVVAELVRHWLQAVR